MLTLSCSRPHDTPVTDCRIDKGPCIKTIMPWGVTASFDIRPKPVKMMSALFFDLSLSRGDRPLADANVFLYLTMPGMYMSEHRVVMSHKGEGKYEGSSVIPHCPSGKRTWKASFVINEANAGSPGAMPAEYIFEVRE